MPTTMKSADVVVIGLGWTGSILSMELASEGLKVVALERGKNRDTSPDFTYPKAADELKYGIRGELFRRLSLETVTVRYKPVDVALPYRQYNAFLLPDNVGGAGVHWNGQLYRPSSEDLKFYTRNVERYGRNFLPENMTIQDYDVTYEDLEPYFDRFEYLNGASGQAGNIKGTITPGGNPFEGPRSRDYPTPPVADTYPAILFANATKQLGYHPFPQPSANCSQPFTNGYNVRLGPCNLCGFCERFGCFLYSKGSPQTTILPALFQLPNFEISTLWNWFEQSARDVFESYNFREIRLPIFEETSLFARSVGGETDIVSKEMYSFPDRSTSSDATADAGDLISLRPEATASTMRAYIEHGMHALPGNVKLYYMGPMFRRERPQKGRYRQFYQIGAEVLGQSDAPAIDAEVIEMLMTFFSRVGLIRTTLYINSIGDKNCRPQYVELLRAELRKVKDQLGADSQRRIETNPLRVLDSKIPQEQEIIAKLPKISEHLCDACREHFAKLKEELKLRGVSYQENWRD